MSKKEVLITDLSRMHGDRVCIFGFDKDKNPIRPVLTSGIRERQLINTKGLFIKPFAVIEFDFIRATPNPPHTEDFLIDITNKPVLIKNLSKNKFKTFLNGILNNNIENMFGTPVYTTPRYKGYTELGKGIKSLGTIKSHEIESIEINKKDNGKYEYRIQLIDNGKFYDMPINDCAFRTYCENQLADGINTKDLASKIYQNLKESEVFLRIGLTRAFKPDFFPESHWLQVSSLYAFPDYRMI